MGDRGNIAIKQETKSKDDVMAETGYGISTSLGDGDDAIVYVDHDEMTVTIDEKSWSFEEYLKADLESLCEE